MLREDNIQLPRNWGMTATIVLGIIGLVCIAATIAYPWTQKGDNGVVPEKVFSHALHSYHAGAAVPLTLMAGSLGLVLIFQLVRAGWCVGIRRPIEHAASLIPFGLVLLAPVFIFEFFIPERAGDLFKWRTPGLIETDHLLAHKAPFLNDTFFLIRVAIYFAVWTFISWKVIGPSFKQDKTNDPSLTVKAGWNSCWGILAYALCMAFAAFDLLMGLDFHWFSTMFGVYFFAGSIFAALALWSLTLIIIRSGGRLEGFYTGEHRHDLGKLTIAFTIFWAYIAFSQYFLIWYANIPEETAWVMARGGASQTNEWTPVFWTLALGHFVAPFLVLLWRNSKRNMLIFGFACVWLLAMHCVDMFWVVRPQVYKTYNDGMGKLGLSWVDITGMIGPLALFLAVYIRKLTTTRLVPVNDPYLHEAATHKNYV
jgi:hypothetical protein